MAAPTSPPRQSAAGSASEPAAAAAQQPQPQNQQQQQPQHQQRMAGAGSASEPQHGPAAIKRTMEYYFSDKNLVRDRFLHSKMAEDATGEKWVRFDVLLTFPKLRKLVHEECESDDQVSG